MRPGASRPILFQGIWIRAAFKQAGDFSPLAWCQIQRGVILGVCICAAFEQWQHCTISVSPRTCQVQRRPYLQGYLHPHHIQAAGICPLLARGCCQVQRTSFVTLPLYSRSSSYRLCNFCPTPEWCQMQRGRSPN